MSRPFLDMGTESTLLDEVAQRRQRLAALRSTVTGASAALAVDYADAYPWMDPTAINSLVGAGVPVDSPAVQSIADAALQEAAEGGEFDDPATDVPDAWYETLWNTATGWAKPIIRGGFTMLTTPFEELQALLSSAGTALFDEDDPAEGFDPMAATGLLDPLSLIVQNAPALVGELSKPGDLVSDFWQNYTSKAARSSGVMALGDLLSGQTSLGEFWSGVDEETGEPAGLGSGFLPGGPIYEEREAAKHRLQLDGQFVTPGRIIARNVVTPGGTAYQALSGASDFAQNIYLDPAAGALKTLSGAAAATRQFRATGLIAGIRNTVDPARGVSHYLTSDVGRRMVNWFTEHSDVEEVWQATGRANLDIARRLAATKTDEETFGVLTDVLGTVVRERPTASFASRKIGAIGGNEYGALFGGGAQVRRSLDNSRIAFLSRIGRLGEDVPATKINIHDLDDAAYQLDLWMRNAQLPVDLRRQTITELASLTPGDQVGVFETVRKVMDNTEGVLVKEWLAPGAADELTQLKAELDSLLPSDPDEIRKGLTAEIRKTRGQLTRAQNRARGLTSLYGDYGDDLAAYDIDDLGRHVDVLAPLRANVGGTVVDARPTPGMVSELVDDVIPLPDFREIRRLTPTVRQMQRLYDSGLWKGSIDGIEAAMTSVWKPLQLLRGAYTVRVIGEEQVRIASSGYDSMISHPMSAIAWSLSVDPKSRLGKKIANLAKKGIDPKGTTNVLGETWDDVVEHTSALSRGSAGHRGFPGEILTGRYIKARQGQKGFFRGWAIELSHEANDPVMRRVAAGLSEGDLISIGRNAAGDTFDDVAEWFWSGTGQKWRKQLGRMEGRSKLLTDKDAAAAYLQQNYFDRLQRMTGGNTDLVELVGKGRLDDVNLRGFGHEQRLADVLEETYAGAAPNFVKMPESIAKSTASTRSLDRLNRGTERLFEGLMSRPTNWLSRSPTFRQKYWQRVGELLDSAPAGIQEEAIRAARKAGLDDGELLGMARRAVAGEGDKLSSLDDIDVLAKAFALDETKKLLYDLQKRSQFFDMMRIVWPFGEAWKEIIGSWTSITRQNPVILRRFQQGLEGARAPSVFGEAETSEGTGSGFFHPDPQTGEEVFTYPALGIAAKALGLNQGGAGLNITGQVRGLNIVAATALPGFGPAVQIPASKLIPETPDWDWLRDQVLPFGESEGILDSFTPAWFEKLQTAFEDPQRHRLFANTVADVQRFLLSTGEYSMDTREAQQKLYDDSVGKARMLYLFRGLAQSTVPTGPSFSWTTKDLEGNILPVKVLSDELRRMTDEEYGGDRNAAFREWLLRFGPDNVLAVIGKSTALLERPVTEKGDDWLKVNSDLERDFELTIGYFAPEPAVGEFDYSAYLRQFEMGARRSVTPDEQIALANDLLGRMQWERAKQVAAFRPGSVTSAWLAQVREEIAAKYPGFDGWVADRVRSQRPEVEQQITELRAAVTEPRLAATDAGQGTILYLSAVDAASKMVGLMPGNVSRYQQAKAAAPVRAWLRSVARQIIEEHPDFARVWYGVFERELVEDPEVFA